MQRVRMFKSTQINGMTWTTIIADVVKENIGRMKCVAMPLSLLAIRQKFQLFHSNLVVIGKTLHAEVISDNYKIFFLHIALFTFLSVFLHKQFFVAVSRRPEFKSDWSEWTVFGRKFVSYGDWSSDDFTQKPIVEFWRKYHDMLQMIYWTIVYTYLGGVYTLLEAGFMLL